jgi:hypothetical protein
MSAVRSEEDAGSSSGSEQGGLDGVIGSDVEVAPYATMEPATTTLDDKWQRRRRVRYAT